VSSAGEQLISNKIYGGENQIRASIYRGSYHIFIANYGYINSIVFSKTPIYKKNIHKNILL